MRSFRLLFCFALFLLGSAAAGAQAKPDFSKLDGVPLSGSEEDVLAAFDQIRAAHAVSSSAPNATSGTSGGLNCPPTGGGLQCTLYRLNHATRRPFVSTFDPYAGMSPTQRRAAQEYGAQHTYCAVPPGQPANGVFDTNEGVQDGKRAVTVKFVQDEPTKSCHVIATTIFTNQLLNAQTVEAQQAIEDESVSVAKAKFGDPTYFMPRHVADVVNRHESEGYLSMFNAAIGAGSGATPSPTLEKRTLPPFAAWCDTGTVADCKSGGPSVNRRLTVGFGNYDGEVLIVELEDLQAERRIHAAITNANVKDEKPQI